MGLGWLTHKVITDLLGFFHNFFVAFMIVLKAKGNGIRDAGICKNKVNLAVDNKVMIVYHHTGFEGFAFGFIRKFFLGLSSRGGNDWARIFPKQQHKAIVGMVGWI